MDELNEAKKDFFENALMGLIDCGYPGAIVFANRTQNADRGYNEKIQLEHTGNVTHSMIDLSELNLDIETRRKILDAIREKNRPENVVDVEVKEIPERIIEKSADDEWEKDLQESAE